MVWRTKLPWIAVAVYFLAALVWLGRDRRVRREAFQPCSTYNTSPEGLSLAYKYLRERARREGGGKVDILTRPVARVPVEPDAVIFRVGPSTPSLLGALRERMREKGAEGGEEEEKKGVLSRLVSESGERLLTPAEESWVSGGGRLVLAVDERWGPVEVAPPDSRTVRKVYPVWPGVENLMPGRAHVLVGGVLDWTHAVFAMGSGALVVRRPLGEGEVFIISCPEIFQNGRLGRADHLALLEELSGPGRPVYFDEYVHGVRSGTGALELLRRAGLGPLVSLLLVTALAAYWRRRTRVGPEEDPYRETRVESVDFVDSLAQLYDRALQRRQAVALYYRAFARSVSVRTGRRGEELDAKVRELTRGLDAPAPGRGRDMGAQEFRRALAALNDAFRRLADVKRT